MSAEYGAEVYDLIAFYQWDFLDKQGRTSIGVRQSYESVLSVVGRVPQQPCRTSNIVRRVKQPVT